MPSTPGYDKQRRQTKPSRSWYQLARWKRKAKACLDRDRVCQMQGCGKNATIADHIEPHRGDEEKFWNGPLQGLCKRCHDSHKQRQERRGYSKLGADGWPVR